MLKKSEKMEKTNNLEQNIHFHIRGENFNPNRGYDLKDLLINLNSIQTMFNKTFGYIF